jgi:hypothetical protein
MTATPGNYVTVDTQTAYPECACLSIHRDVAVNP